MFDQEKSLVIMTTVPVTLKFHAGFLRRAKEEGYIVNCITSTPQVDVDIPDEDCFNLICIDMSREIELVADLVALVRIFFVLKKIKPDVLHVSTPKASLLGLIVGRCIGTNKLVYTLRGVRYLGAKGVKRCVLQWVERITCSLATDVISTSNHSMNVVVNDGICAHHKIKVIGSGTGNGVDARHRFNPENYSKPKTNKLKLFKQFSDYREKVVFVGRIVREKGIEELIEAWDLIQLKHNSSVLLLAGNFEDHDSPSDKTLAKIKDNKSIVHLGRVPHKDIPELLLVSDVLVLPSYREGFGIAPLEASAMCLPVVASRVDGLQEAVVDGVTGLHVAVGQSYEIYQAVSKILTDKSLSKQLGMAGRSRVLRDFNPNDIWEAYLRIYAQQ